MNLLLLFLLITKRSSINHDFEKNSIEYQFIFWNNKNIAFSKCMNFLSSGPHVEVLKINQIFYTNLFLNLFI
jgi:hypothetical protein